MSKIILNIVEPGGSTPIDPGTEPIVPNTGLFTKGIGGPEATIITISIVAILAIVATAVLYYKKKHSKENKEHKANKANKLANALAIAKTKKKVSIPLAALALVISLGTLAALLVNAGKSNTNAAENTEDTLTVKESDQEFTIELADEPVFAVLPVELTVEEATEAGYTLTAYADSTDLVSATDDSKVIPMVAADEGELVALAENTYGLSLAKPESQDDKAYTTLSTDADNPTFITDKDYEETKENDITTIYYGFYITPDTPYGTYEGSEINYAATANRADLVKVTFDGNGLTFNGAETNVTRYIPNTSIGTTAYSHTPNVNDEGVQDGMYGYNLDATNVYQFADTATNVHVKIVKSGNDSGCGPHQDDYFTFWTGSHPAYTAKADYASAVQAFGNTSGKYVFGNYNDVETDLSGVDAVTFAYTTNGSYQDYCTQSGYGYYAVITAMDADGNNVDLLGNELYVGNYQTPSSDASYKFLGWSTEKDATTPMFASAQDIALGLDLSAGDEVTLYAVYEPTFAISYNGNGADSTTDMNDVTQYSTVIAPTGKSVDLLASNFTKEGYGFVGWSTDSDAWDNLTDADPTNDPTIYGPNQTITINEDVIAEAGENRKLILNAVWAPVETTASGDPVSLQDWQGCSSLTATTYDAETGTLSVGKNTITALADNRDGNIYTVARLADGNCWMTENLRLDNEATISTTNTNNPVTVDNNVAIKNNDGNTSAHLSPTNDSWCTNSDSDCYDQSYLNTNNTALTTASPVFNQDFTSGSHANLDDKISSYGNYYNWYSATAANGTYSKYSGEVAGDICPTGWSLPLGSSNNTSGSFYYLNQQMGGNTSEQGSNNWRSFPNNFVYSGGWFGSSAGSRGIYGFYWSSTAYNTDFAYSLYFYSSYVSPTYNYYKYGGYSVRCVVSQ